MSSLVDLYFRRGLGGLALLALSLALVLTVLSGLFAVLAAFVRGFTGKSRAVPAGTPEDADQPAA